jgi:hypothetical protein
MLKSSIKYRILFFTLFFALLCKIPLSVAQTQSKVNAQDEGSDVGVLRLDGNKITSTMSKSTTSAEKKSFSDKIKVLRVSEGEWDVYFETNGGPFAIPDKELDNENTYQNVFQKAYESKSPLQVTVDTDKNQIITVQKSNPPTRQPASSSGFEQIPEKYKYMEDIFKKNVHTPAD